MHHHPISGSCYLYNEILLQKKIVFKMQMTWWWIAQT